MGLIFLKKEKNQSLGIWEMSESINELNALIKGVKFDHLKSPKRILEILAVRVLLKEMCGNVKLDYNKYGAPVLDINKNISISHSKQLVAIIVSKSRSGIDTEIISKRILKIKDKFISKYDNINESQEDLTIAWSTKECIFKWNQKGNINFKDDILIKSINHSTKKIEVSFDKNLFILNFIKINNHILVYVCKQ
jgi:phosphopantetheinyl transferase (holo-ACP synthase)